MFILPDAQEQRIIENIDTCEKYIQELITDAFPYTDHERREAIARLVSEQITDACLDGLMEGEAIFDKDPLFTGNSVDDEDDTVQLVTEWDGATNSETDSSIKGFRSVWSEIISDTVVDQLG